VGHIASESVVPLWCFDPGERFAVALRELRLSPTVGVGHIVPAIASLRFDMPWPFSLCFATYSGE
jgi:hypothetical protein